jgi:putative transposase
MTPSHRTSPSQAVASVLDPSHVEAEAARLGVVSRRRKVDAWILVWVLVLGFQVGTARTLEGLRQAYERAAGHTLARSAFHSRLSESLARLLRTLAEAVMRDLGPAMGVRDDHLTGFRELIAMDATVLRLHALLARDWPACRTNHTQAAAKMHVAMRVVDGSPMRVKLTGERAGDSTVWRRLGPWVDGCLLLFDLGYYDFHLFARIADNGGFFVTRAKRTFNPVIVSANRRWRGQSIEVLGERLQDVLPRIEREVLDVNVEISYRTRKYRGRRRTRTRLVRLVAIRNADTGDYHLYLTNVPPSRLTADDVAKTYSLRWQVEIFFKAMRSHGHLGHIPSSKKAVVEVLVWASVLATLASQALYRMVRQSVCRTRHMPPLRWAALFARIAGELLDLIVRPSNDRDRALFDRLRHDGPDPNRSRRDRAMNHVPMPLVA